VKNDPIECAQRITDLLADVCYPVAKYSLEIAGILLNHRLNGQMSAVLAAGIPAAEHGSAPTPRAQM